MTDEKDINHLSKFLSLILRHRPETIGISLDKNGFADVAQLIEKVNENGWHLDRETLAYLVETNGKKRFAFNGSRYKIRASQGHSIPVDLGYESLEPPTTLYHGTGEGAVPAILEQGLLSRKRQYVHLSTNIETAKSVGMRHGKPVVFQVLAGEMFRDGLAFFLSENGVWLTNFVSVSYLRKF